jgi:predicted phage terminase large subunit-like protein
MSDEQTLQDVLEELLGQHLYSFVWRAFETLHHNQSFIPAGHVEAICWHLQQVAEDRIRRLLITMPPRYLKSICTSVGFAAWMLGRDPAHGERPPRAFFQMVVQSWDTAVTAEPTSDFSVCTTWGYREGKWYLLDVYRARLEYPALKRKVIELRDRWQADPVVVEKANTGEPLCQEFRSERLGRLEPYIPCDKKETRFAVQTDKIERGMVLIPKEADWLPAFKRELLAFPNGRYDDQVDSMTQFLDWIGKRRGRAKCGLNGGRPADVERPLDVARPPARMRPESFRRPP